MGYLIPAIGIGVVISCLWRLAPIIIRSFFSPLRDLPGPPSPHWFFGHFKLISREENSAPQERWMEQYGSTITYKGLFGLRRLWTMDTRALNHVLTHSVDYEKPIGTRLGLSRLLGAGVLITEGTLHQENNIDSRRIMNPAFGPAQIRDLTEIFVEKAIQLRDIWAADISKASTPRVDVFSGLGKMTLDVIGLAGFNYQFDALNEAGRPNELNQAFRTIFNSDRGPSVLAMIQRLLPALDYIPTKDARRVYKARKVMHKIGMEILAEKKATLLQQGTSIKVTQDSDAEKRGVSRQDLQGRDLLTVLLKANMATDIPDNQRLSDEDVLAQVPTFLVAGHETTASATTWCLYALTQHPGIQNRLREELRTVDTETPSMDELLALPYLDAVVRETLRVYPPVSMTIRAATKEDLIPLNTPFVDKNGNVRDSIRVAKGDLIVIPILAMNRAKNLWGEDALEFRPERWDNPPESITSIPGVWGNILTFIGGPRACIGYRFSLLEMKALIFTLVRSFEFGLAVAPEDLGKRKAVVQRPFVKSEPDKGNQMPLILKHVVSP